MYFHLNGNRKCLYFANNVKGFMVETTWQQIYIKENLKKHSNRYEWLCFTDIHIQFVIVFFPTKDSLEIATIPWKKMKN